MKKIYTFVGCALFIAAMSVSCGNNNAETADSIADTTPVENVIEEPAPEAEAQAPAMSEADHAAMLDAAREAGRAKCNCYKKDAASVEACIKSILAQSYAAYENNEEFKAAMEEEFNSCVKEKAKAAAKDAANDAAKSAASAIANKLGGK